MDTDIHPFKIAVPDAVLADLRARLHPTRWPEAEPVTDWSQGAPLAWIQAMCRYWADGYDWRAREALLNRHAQYTTRIDGLDIHFVHVRSPHAQARPLLITHGWPGSMVEFQKVIGPLTDPTAHGGDAADAFHLVCPSLPGFGFSAKPTTTGWGVDRIAAAWATWMARLGYGRYGAQGGDWGSAVTTAIGSQDAAHCLGIHITLAMGTAPLVDGTPTAEAMRARNARQRDAVLGHGQRRLVGPVVLGEFWRRPACGAAGDYADRRGGVSEGNRHTGAALDGRGVYRHPALDRDAQGRALWRLRAAGAVCGRCAGVFQGLVLSTAKSAALQ